jgi:hypothetical protein
VNELLDQLDAFAEQCGGAVVVTRRGTIVTDGESLEAVELGVHGGEWIEVGVADRLIRTQFGGWVECFTWADGDAEASEEAAELALDFVAAALFGELRIVEQRLGGRVLRRSLDVYVGELWRTHAKLGALGLDGVIALIRGRLERRARTNEGRLRRPRKLRDGGPSGQPRFPWAGSARSTASAAAELAIDGELDLHNFSPKEVAPLVREYIEVCRQRGVHELRIVHGKGKGVLRRTVHSLLESHEAVESYRLGGHGEGSWGATIVRLRE